MKEYIVPLNDTAKDWDEMFIAVIRKQEELIRCKDCEYHGKRTNMCDIFHCHTNPNGYCHRGRIYGQTESGSESK